jgi:hypothetical protein
MQEKMSATQAALHLQQQLADAADADLHAMSMAIVTAQAQLSIRPDGNGGFDFAVRQIHTLLNHLIGVADLMRERRTGTDEQQQAA